MHEITGSIYSYQSSLREEIEAISRRVAELRRIGKITPEVLYHLRQFFKIKNIYHSNAIEGNLLNIGETRQVVEMGLTITGKSLKDQAEAKNLAAAIDFLEEMVQDKTKPITLFHIREIHSLVLKGIDNENAGGYRKVPVEISGSKYTPPSPELLLDEMDSFGKWLEPVSCPGERFATAAGILFAAAAHTWLVYIHPFIDGNGRVARLIMNLILMRYGFPIAIISREDRLRYYEALEESQSSDLSYFIGLLAESVHESLEEYEMAAEEHRERMEWAKSLASRFSQPELIRVRNEYEVWKSAMDLLKNHMRQIADLLNSSAGLAHVYFKDFGTLEFEKYLGLRKGESTKRTWFFRVDFRVQERTTRYLFFFGYPSHELRNTCEVTLFVSREDPPGSYYYERLKLIRADNVPEMDEIGYDMKDESFRFSLVQGGTKRGKVEKLGRTFFEKVIQHHFSS